MIMTLANAATAMTPSAQPSSEVDIELFTFVERYATNLVRWDLLLFFGNHPDARLSAAEIAQELRRSLSTILKELDDLAYLRVLDRRYTPKKTTFQLSHKPAVQRAVIRLAAYARDESATK